MKLLSSLALFFSLLPHSCFSTLSGNEVYLLKESVSLPRDWHRVSAANPNHKLRLRIGLVQPRFNVLEQHLFEVSDPDHHRYGQHLSKEDVETLVAPESASLDAVDNWLASHGLTEQNITRSPAKDWAYVTVSVRLAEQMLNTTYHLWQHRDSGQHIVRTTSYKLPSGVFDHLDVIQPTTIFSRWQPMKSAIYWAGSTGLRPSSRNKLKMPPPSTPVVDASCAEIVTIKCLSQLYRTLGYVPKATKKNGIGITGYLEQFANYEDLRSFFTAQLPQAVNLTYTFHSVKGGLNNQTLDEAGIEAGLDTQYAFGLAFPTPGTFWSTAGRAVAIPDDVHQGEDNEPFADWIDFVLKQRNVPQSISTSYAEHEQTVPESYARRVCAGFAQLGARGVTLTFASGDLGVGDGNADPETQLCFTNDGKNTTRFLSMFPASCPYVTTVGGTWNIPEVGVPFSGGGFSDYFSQPDYQKSAVQKYLAQLPDGLYKGLYNKKGRAIPDISAQSWLYQSWWKGEPYILGGTSASSPTVAAIVALLNDARLANGLPTLGFLNPLLYSKGTKGINDIIEGNNPGCGTSGFEALPGWDPVTGLGTPDFIKLKGIVA